MGEEAIGNPESTEALIRSALPLARAIARQFHRPGLEFEDLQAEGVLGLVLAARRYDPDRGVSFRGYGRFWVKALVLRHVEKQGVVVNLGGSRTTRMLFQGLNKERRRLGLDGRDADNRTLARVFGIPEAEIEAFDQARHAPAFSLNGPKHGDEGRNAEESISLADDQTPEEACIEAEERALISAWFDRFESSLLTARDRAIWRRRIRSVDPVTQGELGRSYGVSKQRIAQVEHTIRDRLRAYAERSPPPTQS